MTGMVYRVAEALRKEFEPYRVFDEGEAERLARAAIEAMREPTAGMLSYRTDDAMVHSSCHMCGGHLEGWHLMIDAALGGTQ